ncbi:MAG TPA: hypothetical protein VL418_07240 [Devosiaceae bacterium]|nr:hypothetical protein [Devosiaceae bacterium]
MGLISRRKVLYSLAATAIAGVSSALVTRSAWAAGNLAHDPIKLPELKIDTVDMKYSQTSYTLETGKFYWWKVTSDGQEEDIGLAAPELFANSWIYQIVSGDDNANEVHTQSLDRIEFDSAGSQIIQFIPIQPGQYDFYTPGFEKQGLTGKILVN